MSVILGGFLVCAVLALIYVWHRNRKMYKVIDRMLDEVLNRETISVSDIREGEISALAGKAKRIQEKMECEIIQAQEEKEQVKSLISNMSHQLKTPLAGVMMYQEILSGEGIDRTQQQKFQKKMKRELDKIDWILCSLFKMVKLEKGGIVFENGPGSLRQTLLSAVNSVYEKAERKSIEIMTEPFEDRLVYHNAKWTAEVFTNILENAVKYTQKEGKIHIHIRPLEMYTQIEIQDTGIGIREEELTEIFKRFYRSRDVENKEGSGIGLYLSRLILDKEKGYMTVSSEPGTGSCFSVFLQNCQK